MNLYTQCHGESWIRNTNWLNFDNGDGSWCPIWTSDQQNDQNPSTWFGITSCASGRVTGLALNGNQLKCDLKTTGLLPPLPQYIQTLDLSNNIIRGFPSSLDENPALTSLILSSSFLSGKIPSSLGPVHTLLTYVDFSHNFLSGPALEGSEWVAQLTYLDLSFNNLTGFVPNGIEGMNMENSAILNGNSFWCPTPNNWSALSPMDQCINVTLISVTPWRSPMSGGGIATLSGSNLPITTDDLEISCNFGDRASSPATITTSTIATCKIPDGAPGIRPISLTHSSKPVSTNTAFFAYSVKCQNSSYVDPIHFDGCKPCPDGAQCFGSDLQPLSLPGYMPAPISTEKNPYLFLKCFEPTACVGNNMCSPKYTGPRCS